MNHDARHGCPPQVYEVSAGDPGDIQVRIDAAPDAIVDDTNADINEPSRDTNDTNLDTNVTNLDAKVVRDGRSAENSLPPLTSRILEMIRGNRGLTIEAMDEICHVSRSMVNRAIKALTGNGRLRRVGGTRGSWEVRS